MASKFIPAACYVCGRMWFEKRDVGDFSAGGTHIELERDAHIMAEALPGHCPQHHDLALIRLTWNDVRPWVTDYCPLPPHRVEKDRNGGLRFIPLMEDGQCSHD